MTNDIETFGRTVNDGYWPLYRANCPKASICHILAEYILPSAASVAWQVDSWLQQLGSGGFSE